MGYRPKWFKMPTVNNLATKRIIMFVVGLRKHKFIFLTCYRDRQVVGLGQLAIRKCEVVTWNTSMILYNFFTSVYLILQYPFIVGVHHIMIHGMCTNYMSSS